MSRSNQESANSLEKEDVFLAHLPPDTPVYHFEGLEQLQTVRPKDNFAIIKGFPPKTFNEYCGKFPGRVDYSPVLQILILKMLDEIHETTAAKFDILLADLAKDMGVRRRIAFRGATNTKTPNRNKQADRSWAPSYRPGDSYRNWPTVVLEVGNSETKAKLVQDITWWINASEGQVKQGITIDVKKGSGNIYISSWVPQGQQDTQPRGKNGREPTKTPDSLLLPPPRCIQHIKFMRERNSGLPVVQGDDLVISSTNLLHEDPGVGQGDFIFTKDLLLEEVVEPFWEALDAEKMG